MKAHKPSRYSASVAIRICENGAAILLALLVWHLAALKLDEPIFLPTPSTVFLRLVDIVGLSEFWSSVLFTLGRTAVGFFCGFLLGLALAVFAARSHIVEVLLRPYLFTVKSIPVASFVVLALVWFSSERLSFVISFLVVLPIVYTNIREGIQNTDPSMLEMATVYRLGFGRRLAYLYIPAIKPYLLSACRIAIGLAWKAGIAAEIIGMPDRSLGINLHLSRIYMQTDAVLAYTVMIILISLLFEKCVLLFLKTAFHFWEKL